MPKPKIGEELELSIETPAFGGFGIARHDGVVVFVRYAYPGERVIARIVKRKKTAMFADAVSILEPISSRRPASCEVYTICGGCSCQDIDYDEQFAIKLNVVKDCLEHIGGFTDYPDPETIHADREFGYRNKMELSFGEDGGEVFLGQHVRGRFDRLVRAENCALMPEVGRRFAREIARRATVAGLAIYNQYRDEGFLRHLTLRFSETTGDFLAGITLRRRELEALRPIFDGLSDEFPQLVGASAVVNQSTGDTAKGEVVPMFGKSFIEEDMLGLRFRISLESFFQTNTRMARIFYNKILDFAEADTGLTAFDLFSGTGTIAQILSTKFKRVIAIESVERAVADARFSADLNDIANIEFIFGSVEKELSNAIRSASPELVVLDPPRSGIAKKSLDKILEAEPRAIIYASCNPSTLARDLGLLAPKYSISRMAIIDMFPQTHHIETLIRLDARV